MRPIERRLKLHGVFAWCADQTAARDFYNFFVINTFAFFNHSDIIVETNFVELFRSINFFLRFVLACYLRLLPLLFVT
jgi:hypothetical protein